MSVFASYIFWSVIRYINVYNCYIFLHIEICINIQCPSLSRVIFFDLKSLLSYISIATLAVFGFNLCGISFFHAFTFNLFVTLDLKWVSCRQHIGGSCVFIHSANLCHWLEGRNSPSSYWAGTVLGPGNKGINKTVWH